MPITIAKDGPYVVTGGLPLGRRAIASNAADESTGWVDLGAVATTGRYFLCRCGQSANKPFCDGTHAKVGFDGAMTATREPYEAQAALFEGPVVAMGDAEALCAFARFCDRDGKVWNTVETTTPGDGAHALTDQIGQCPSGRLTARDKAAGRTVEPALEPTLFLIEDPVEACSGPIFAAGGIQVVDAAGAAWEVRNRVTLCRCGASRNKPFCDGSHATVKFRDESAP